jgi:hypothetical protein
MERELLDLVQKCRGNLIIYGKIGFKGEKE